MNLYTFGDSVLDSKRYSGVTAPEIVAKKLGFTLDHYAQDGATSEHLDSQWRTAREALAPGIAMISIGGNDLLTDPKMNSDARFVFGCRLNRLLLRLKGADIRAYVANIYDPTFGKDSKDFLNLTPTERKAVRHIFNAVNHEIATATLSHGSTLVDLRAHFLKGKPDWFTQIIEPSAKGAEEVAKAFLKEIE